MHFTKSDEGDEQIVLSFRQLWGLVREFIRYLTFHNQVNKDKFCIEFNNLFYWSFMERDLFKCTTDFLEVL